MYRHVARCHLDLAQLWRCPVLWCTVWKGAPQDLMDHIRGAHKDILLFSDIGLSLAHHYRVHKKGVPHVTFHGNYMSQLRALLPLSAVRPTEGGSADPECSSVLDFPGVACASPRPSRRTFARRRSTRVMEAPGQSTPRLTSQDPQTAVGAVVLDCRPQVLTRAMAVSGSDLTEIRSMTRATLATAAPPEREQSFGGGGGDFDMSGVGRDSASRTRN